MIRGGFFPLFFLQSFSVDDIYKFRKNVVYIPTAAVSFITKLGGPRHAHLKNDIYNVHNMKYSFTVVVHLCKTHILHSLLDKLFFTTSSGCCMSKRPKKEKRKMITNLKNQAIKLGFAK